jgi:hypothetical protein
MDRDKFESRDEFAPDAPARLLKSMQDVNQGVDQKMGDALLSLFSG